MWRVGVVAIALIMASGPVSAQSIKAGEYACFGSGGRILIGLGFKAYADGRYTDLDNKERGTYAVGGGTITFKGGHLNGQVGRNLKGSQFTIGSVSCEPS